MEIEISYWPNGRIESEHIIIDTTYSIDKWYYKNGKTGYENYKKNGRWHGFHNQYNPNGTRDYIKYFKNGRFHHGTQIIFKYGN